MSSTQFENHIKRTRKVKLHSDKNVSAYCLSNLITLFASSLQRDILIHSSKEEIKNITI